MPHIGEKGEVKKKFLALDLCATYRREGGGKEEEKEVIKGKRDVMKQIVP